jgi:hypothetical protein
MQVLLVRPQRLDEVTVFGAGVTDDAGLLAALFEIGNKRVGETAI